MTAENDLIDALRLEKLHHAESAGVHRCYCEFCVQACAELAAISLRKLARIVAPIDAILGIKD